jgi:hypothetical protein
MKSRKSGGLLIDDRIRNNRQHYYHCDNNYFVPVLGYQRTKAFNQLAQIMNLTFSEKGDDSVLNILGGFHLFSQGYSRKIANILTGNLNKIPVTIFEYRYTTGGGKSTKIWRQTVILLESDQLQLPSFVLRPENLLDKIENVFGHKDIDFEAYPNFSKHYLLRGNNEEAVRKIFTDPNIAYYEEHPGLSTEVDGNRLIFYRGSKVVPVNKIQSFMEQGYDIFTLFKTN